MINLKITENDLTIDPDKRDNALVLYGELHDGLSDMIESSRLTESDIPDDYGWLVDRLTRLGNFWKRGNK